MSVFRTCQGIAPVALSIIILVRLSQCEEPVPAEEHQSLKVLKQDSDFLFWHLWRTPNNTDDTHPNISGIFRGTWKQETYDKRLRSSYVPHKSDGILTLTMRVTGSSAEGVDVVEGRLRLHDGLDLVGLDCYMKVHGMYVRSSGRLHATLTPTVPVLLRLGQSPPPPPAQSPEPPDPSAPPPEPASSGSPDLLSHEYLKSLRDMADRYSKGRAPLPTSMQQLEGAITECSFRMELEVYGPQKGQELNSSMWRHSHLHGGAEISGAVFSENCHVGWSINATSFNSDKLRSKAARYSLVSTFVTAAQHLLVVRLLNHATNSPTVAQRMSVLSVGMQSVIDAYLCLLHLTFALVADSLFSDFAMVALFEFVLFALLEMRLVLLLWRVHRGVEADVWNAHRELSMVYTRFYAALLSGVFAAYQLYHLLPGVLVLLYSWWLPQIIHSARNDTRQPIPPFQIFAMSATRLALPLYFYGCPHNILSLRTSPAFCLVITAWVGLQCGILAMQHKWGPRSFIPKRFLPPKYDYFRPATQRERGLSTGETIPDEESGLLPGTIECVICMCPVEVDRVDQRMITPCGHFFHSQCLERWMDVKMECPTCRSALPQP